MGLCRCDSGTGSLLCCGFGTGIWQACESTPLAAIAVNRHQSSISSLESLSTSKYPQLKIGRLIRPPGKGRWGWQKEALRVPPEQRHETKRRTWGPHRLQPQSTLVPTRRQRAVSAAVVAPLCTPPPHRCSRTGHCGCSRCSGRRDGDWWKPCHSTSTSPTRREATRTRRGSLLCTLPPDVCTNPHGVLLGRLKRTTDSAPGPARRKNV
jgi:hypothetical protein